MKFVKNNKILEDSNAESAEISAEKRNMDRPGGLSHWILRPGVLGIAAREFLADLRV
jgi:hypothetical protein